MPASKPQLYCRQHTHRLIFYNRVLDHRIPPLPYIIQRARCWTTSRSYYDVFVFKCDLVSSYNITFKAKFRIVHIAHCIEIGPRNLESRSKLVCGNFLHAGVIWRKIYLFQRRIKMQIFIPKIRSMLTEQNRRGSCAWTAPIYSTPT